MSTDYPIFYEELATGINDMSISISANLDAIEKVMELLTYLMDLTTDVDFNVGQALVDISPIMREKVYSGLITLPRDEDKLLPGVVALNNHTKKYINPDLTDFVNNEVWPGDCVPSEWARLSERTGEDISEWTICETS